MHKRSFATLSVGLMILAVGCGRTAAPEHKTTSSKTTRLQKGHTHDHDHAHDHLHKAGEALDDAQHAVELQAKRAQRGFDDAASETESAYERTKQQIRAKVQTKTRDLSEYSAELAEEAKDRAEDVPEAVDEAAARIKNSLRSGARAAEQRLKDAEERLSEEDTDVSR